MTEKSGQRGEHRVDRVQPLEPLHPDLTRTMDGTDRQNLADTAIVGLSYEHRSHAPQRTATQTPSPPSEHDQAQPSARSSLSGAVLPGVITALLMGGLLYWVLFTV